MIIFDFINAAIRSHNGDNTTKVFDCFVSTYGHRKNHWRDGVHNFNSNCLLRDSGVFLKSFVKGKSIFDYDFYNGKISYKRYFIKKEW